MSGIVRLNLNLRLFVFKSLEKKAIEQSLDLNALILFEVENELK